MIQTLDAINNIAENYDVFLVDQWGVIHDGFNGFPWAIKALKILKEKGKIIIILSNSSKPFSESSALLERLGFVKNLHYDDIITSGIDVRVHLEKKDDDFYHKLGNRVFRYPWNPCDALIKNLPYQEVFSAEEADFILCTGEEENKTLENYRPVLEKAISYGLPLICPNPDKVSLRPDGKFDMCPGAIASFYEELGGKVRWHGKPHLPIYQTCFNLAASALGRLEKARCVGIGDSLHHDIKGAKNAGIKSVLIASGIHYERVTIAGKLDYQKLQALCEKENIFPDYAIDVFC